MLVALDYSGSKQAFVDIMELYCAQHCPTYAWLQKKGISRADRLGACGFCELNGLKRWVGYTNSFEGSDFAKAVEGSTGAVNAETDT